MCLAQGPQRSDAGEARTRGFSVSSQALNRWARALPGEYVFNFILRMYWLFNTRIGLNTIHKLSMYK